MVRPFSPLVHFPDSFRRSRSDTDVNFLPFADEAQCSASLTITLPGSSTSLPTISTKPDQLFLKKTDAREYLSSVAIEDDYRLLEDALVELMLTQDAEEEVGESLSSLESIARFFRLLVKLASSVCAKVKEWCSEILRILKSLFSRGVQAVRSVPAAEWKALASFLVGVYKSDNRAGYIGKKAFLKALDLLKKLMLNPQVRNAVNGVLEGLARNNVFDLNAFVERMGGQTGEWARDTFLTAV